jgi:hypothetical protein
VSKQEKKQSSSNVTFEKLSDLPFKTAKALKDAQQEVQMHIWRRLEEAKALHQFLDREEYKFWHKEFEQGLVCGYGEKTDNLVRVYSQGRGIQIDINKDLAANVPSSEALLGTLVKSMSESFATTYYKAKGILPVIGNEAEADKKK